ncbi:MAG: peptidylprolyl isomerase [Lachnospiraceae bacterium]|nr:peptidylprolyl isomerase [Lachnospiraceae bacterium]
MKKFLCLALTMAVLFTGCAVGSAKTDKTNTTGGTETKTGDNTNENIGDEVDAENDEYAAKLLAVSDSMPQLEAPQKGEEIAVITTSLGEIKVKFCPIEAPKAVENFISLAKKGYYDGLTFHRVINDFMIQGGDPEGTGSGGESIWGKDFEDEFSPNMYHFRGALAMANSGADTNGSQFYIVQKPTISDGYFDYVKQVIDQYGDTELLYNQSTNKIFRTNYSDEVKAKYEELGGTPELDYGYTIFGQAFEGLDVVDAIAKVETNDKDKPLQDVIVEKIEIVNYGE